MTYKNTYLFLAFVIAVVLAYFWFAQTSYFVDFKEWSEQNLLIFVSVLFIFKVVGIIFPPIPGGLLTLGAVPILGWWQAYLIDFAGAMTGSSLAYFLGKKYGNVILSKFFDPKIIERVHKIKIRKNRQIESIFVLRFLVGGTFTEIVCYAAGILGISYRNFLIGSILSHIVLGVPIYYFAYNLFDSRRILINLLILAIAIPLIWKFRGRYLE